MGCRAPFRGYVVEGKPYGIARDSAIARAATLADLYGRPIPVYLIADEIEETCIYTALPIGAA